MSLNGCMYELCHDTELNRLINSCNENRNRNVIEYILNKCPTECRFEGILKDFERSLKESVKNYERSHDLMYEACKIMECNDYEEAIKLWNESLQYLPHTHSTFVDDIQTILTGRGYCFEKLERPDELARNDQITESLYKALNGQWSREHKNSQAANSNYISPLLEAHLYRNQHSRQYKVGFRAKRLIIKNNLLIREKPIVIVRPLDGDYCLNCDTKIGDSFYPCLLCRDIKYCNIYCAEDGYNFHKYECGLLRAFYKNKMILHLNMLRFYSKINQSPFNDFDPGRNYLFNYQQNFCDNSLFTSGNSNNCLNSLRQSLVQTEKPKSVYFRPKLFGNIFRTIIFEMIYSFCLRRAEYSLLIRKKNRFVVQRFDPRFIDDLKRISKLLTVFTKMDRLDVLVKIFDDVNRFDDCSFIEGTSFPWSDDDDDDAGVANNNNSNSNKISYIPILCSGLTSHHTTQHSEVWTLDNGYLSVRASRDIYQGAVVSIINRFHKQKSQKMYEIIEHLRKDAMIEHE